ncbi:MAG: hypothetical protein SGPRY_010248, partial [Prymnesium sp.]
MRYRIYPATHTKVSFGSQRQVQPAKDDGSSRYEGQNGTSKRVGATLKHEEPAMIEIMRSDAYPSSSKSIPRELALPKNRFNELLKATSDVLAHDKPNNTAGGPRRGTEVPKVGRPCPRSDPRQPTAEMLSSIRRLEEELLTPVQTEEATKVIERLVQHTAFPSAHTGSELAALVKDQAVLIQRAQGEKPPLQPRKSKQVARPSCPAPLVAYAPRGCALAAADTLTAANTFAAEATPSSGEDRRFPPSRLMPLSPADSASETTDPLGDPNVPAQAGSDSPPASLATNPPVDAPPEREPCATVPEGHLFHSAVIREVQIKETHKRLTKLHGTSFNFVFRLAGQAAADQVAMLHWPQLVSRVCLFATEKSPEYQDLVKEASTQVNAALKTLRNAVRQFYNSPVPADSSETEPWALMAAKWTALLNRLVE